MRLYCHQTRLIWLSQANVLINEECGVQLSDFGLSDLVKTRTASVSRVFPEGVTSRWMAPELLQYDFVFPVESSSDLDQSGEARPTFAADVYAFACVCVEVCRQFRRLHNSF